MKISISVEVGLQSRLESITADRWQMKVLTADTMAVSNCKFISMQALYMHYAQCTYSRRVCLSVLNWTEVKFIKHTCSQWRSQRGVFGVQTPSIEKGVHFCCLVIEQKQRLLIKIIVTRCRILRLKCTKFRFWLGLRPRPHWVGGGSALHRPPS